MGGTKVNWRKWRLGLILAGVSALLSAGAGLAGNMDAKAFIAVLCVSLLTNLKNYLQQFPVEDITETAHLPKPEAPDKPV